MHSNLWQTPQWQRPFWLGRTVFGESGLFIPPTPGQMPAVRLIFHPTSVLAVMNGPMTVTYEEGLDFVVDTTAGELHLTPDSRIAFRTLQDLTPPLGSQPYGLRRRDGRGDILFGASSEYHEAQVQISYQHTDTWPLAMPVTEFDRLARTLGRLQRREPIKLVIFGDSISTGANASDWANTDPHQPFYGGLLADRLHSVFGSDILPANHSVGGVTSHWGLENIQLAIGENPDLLILAFGMNDGDSSALRDNTDAMIQAVHSAVPHADIIVVASMTANEQWVAIDPSRFDHHLTGLKELVGPGVALADVTTVWQQIMQRKTHYDLTGNGVNHPNDFGHRVYAQVIGSLLIDDQSGLSASKFSG